MPNKLKEFKANMKKINKKKKEKNKVDLLFGSIKKDTDTNETVKIKIQEALLSNDYSVKRKIFLKRILNTIHFSCLLDFCSQIPIFWKNNRYFLRSLYYK